MKQIDRKWKKKPKWMGWDRVMIYIPEDGKVKMAKDAPGVLEKLIPNATMVESGLLAETPYRMIREKTKGRGKKNKLATAVSGKSVKGAALIIKETADEYGECSWGGMTAEEAGKWVGKIMKAKGNLA